MGSGRLICILGIDTFREKIAYQTRWLAGRGFTCEVLTTARSPIHFGANPGASITVLERRLVPRLRQLLRYFRTRRGELHHVEVYVASRFAFVYAALSRVFGVKVLVVERGDLRCLQQRTYPLTTRLSMYACYLLAHRIWYKELYGKSFFGRLTPGRAFLLNNAVPIPPLDDVLGLRRVDLLWANRLLSDRHPDWFSDAIVSLQRNHSFAVDIVGFLPSQASAELLATQEYVRTRLGDLQGCRLHEFTDPKPFFQRSRFFVLPADVVFCNYALLEAMSYGVVPIVSNTEGADLIVEDGVSGIVAEHSAEGLRRALEKALTLCQLDWERLSRGARAAVEERFGVDPWGRKLLEEYRALAEIRGGRPTPM